MLAWTPLAGGVPAPDWSLTAAINYAAGNKLDAYLATDVEMRVQGDCDSLSGGEVTIGLELGRIPPGLPDYVTVRCS